MSRFNGKRGRFSRFSLSTSSTPPSGYPVVTGGTLFSAGNYYYRVFNYTDSLTVSNGSINAEILSVAGGGGGGAGGGYESGGGGGAGGVVFTMTIIPSNTYQVFVGAGGSFNSNGSDSYISNASLPAFGGGFGGPYGAGGNGGSGGGAPGWGAHTQPGLGVDGQGYRGGYGTYDYGSSLSGGGGGAASKGGDAVSYTSSGNGGLGTSAFSDWGNATETGQLVGTERFYAGGGGGGSNWFGNYPGGAGANGGGGAGGSNGSSAMMNTGGGGGGSNNDYSFAGSGGSGIVIIKYAKSEVEEPVFLNKFVATDVGIGTWTVPNDVSQISVEAWGAGSGAIGQDANYGAGSGGGYSRSILSVTPGATIWYAVGQGGFGGQGAAASGENSWANIYQNFEPTKASDGVLAYGGPAFPNTGGAPLGIGTLVYGTPNKPLGPETGGGSSATKFGAGNIAVAGLGTPGADAPGGGLGGVGGGTSQNGGDGQSNEEGGGGGGGSYNNAGGQGGAPGGAGGQGYSFTNGTNGNTNPHSFGGDGARGQIRITW